MVIPKDSFVAWFMGRIAFGLLMWLQKLLNSSAKIRPSYESRYLKQSEFPMRFMKRSANRRICC